MQDSDQPRAAGIAHGEQKKQIWSDWHFEKICALIPLHITTVSKAAVLRWMCHSWFLRTSYIGASSDDIEAR